MPIQTLENIIEFTDEFKELCERRRTLGAYVIQDDDDRLALSLMWDALADQYEEAAYPVNAGMCRKKAAYYGRSL